MNPNNIPENDCTSAWSEARSGSTRRNQLYPEFHSTYWMYRIIDTQGGKFGLKFTGEFGHARFQSFTVYNDGDEQGNRAGTQIGSLADIDIFPDEGSQNPYLSGADRTNPNRSYTVVVVPTGSSKTRGVNPKNVITFDPEYTAISIWLRVYLPDFEVAHTTDGASGGVPPAYHSGIRYGDG